MFDKRSDGESAVSEEGSGTYVNRQYEGEANLPSELNHSRSMIPLLERAYCREMRSVSRRAVKRACMQRNRMACTLSIESSIVARFTSADFFADFNKFHECEQDEGTPYSNFLHSTEDLRLCLTLSHKNARDEPNDSRDAT